MDNNGLVANTGMLHENYSGRLKPGRIKSMTKMSNRRIRDPPTTFLDCRSGELRIAAYAGGGGGIGRGGRGGGEKEVVEVDGDTLTVVREKDCDGLSGSNDIAQLGKYFHNLTEEFHMVIKCV